MKKWVHVCALGLALTAAPFIFSEDRSPALLKAKELSEEISLQLRDSSTLLDRTNILLKSKAFYDTFTSHPELKEFFQTATLEDCYVLGLMISLGQFDTLFNGFDTIENKQDAMKKLISTLVEIDKFYAPIGGILGYHLTVLKLMTASESPVDTDRYSPPPFQDIRGKTPEVWSACYDGVKQLNHAASIFALGGAGDRLNLIDEKTKEPLPAARLIFCGRSLFEGLMRDVEAQEYWHYRVFGDQVVMPILIMTSKEKNNDAHIEAMGNAANWFGHRQDAIRRIIQPLVPVIDTEGQWAMSGPLELALKPGGHGVLWKLAEDSGAVKWLTFHGIDAAVVRQVNNPLAGLDQALPTLIGYGLSNHKSFGFLSCPSKPGFAEGLNVLSVKRDGASAQGAISNIEYTQFSILKNLLPNLFKEGACPANTNILFIDLRQINKALAKDPIPGMIVNAKTNVEVVKDGQVIKKTGGRLESCMQNIADGMMAPLNLANVHSLTPDSLPTFLLLQDREKLMSATKKAYQPGQNPVETTASCLYDWNKAMRSLLNSSCQFSLPKEQTLDEFLRDGPSVIFSFHPAMGPLWEVIGQKLCRGTIAEGAELELEIAEISCTDLSVEGSLKIISHVPTGPINGSAGRTYTDKVGRARLNNVKIANRGLKSRDVISTLKGTNEHHELCEIILEGFSEVVANNIAINGNFSLVVPDGQRAILSQDQSGKVHVSFEPIAKPSWHYAIEWSRSSTPKLKIQE